MKFPKVDLEELNRQKEQNFQERLKFIDLYVEWLKKMPNKEWSRQQKQVVDSAEK